MGEHKTKLQQNTRWLIFLFCLLVGDRDPLFPTNTVITGTHTRTHTHTHTHTLFSQRHRGFLSLTHTHTHTYTHTHTPPRGHKHTCTKHSRKLNMAHTQEKKHIESGRAAYRE